MDPEALRKLAVVSSLRETFIFRGLPDEDVDRIAGYVVPKRLAKNDYLFRENDPAEGFFIVRRGLINVHRRAPDGREQVIHIFRPGDTLAEVALVGPIGYPADARAEADGEVLLVPRDAFVRHQQENGRLAWLMLASMSQHLRTLVSSLENLRLRDAETRFLHWLLQKAAVKEGPARIELGMSKGLFASGLGIRQETFSRMLAKFRDLGWIDVDAACIVVPELAILHDAFEKNIGTAAE
ncbi:MAG: Crp/Fnr family transcriptional regulator [Luteolibacter sp.]